MRLLIGIGVILAVAVTPISEAQCGKVNPSQTGTIQEWPKEPVDFKCERGFSELSLCIINRTGVEWLNAGKDFVAINDGNAVYAITRDTHPAHPTIVRRGVVSDPKTGAVDLVRSACGYGDKATFDALMKQYEHIDERLLERPQGRP